LLDVDVDYRDSGHAALAEQEADRAPNAPAQQDRSSVRGCDPARAH
jgi:hypothetical protein